jgi:hypothetical protein
MVSFRPTMVAYPNFIDNHPDHQATALFVTAALADLHFTPRCLEYVVHVNRWPRPLRYAPFVDSYAPPAARVLGLRQEVVHLTPQEVGIKAHAIQAQASELLPVATLVAFARRTEVFLAPADLSNKTDPEQIARFFFPLPSGGTFGQAPKLHVTYRGGSATATVVDLGVPGAKPVTVPVTHQGAEVSFVFSDELTGGSPRGFFLRLERAPGHIDTTRSRTVWIGIAPAVP